MEQEHSFAVLDFLEKMLRMRASERWDCSELMRHWFFTKFLGREGHDELLWANWGQVRPIRFAGDGGVVVRRQEKEDAHGLSQEPQ